MSLVTSKASDNKYRYLKNFMEWIDSSIFYPIKSFDLRVEVLVEGSVGLFEEDIQCDECKKRARDSNILSAVRDFPWNHLDSVSVEDIVS